MTNKRRTINVNVPRECHLWTKPGITAGDIQTALVQVSLYEDDSHLIRTLLKCRLCGQLYFHEFYEIVDWEQGNDAQYSSWIPIDDPQSAYDLNMLAPLELLRFGGLRIDFPTTADQPTPPYWRTSQPKD